MTPSEKDLRTSLHQGEGEPIDVNRIVAAGSAARAQRRTRLAGVAAAVVLVVAAGSVTGVVLSRGSNDTTSDGSSASGAGAAYSQEQGRAAGGVVPVEPAPTASPSSASSGSSSASSAGCPTDFPQRLLPGGGLAGALFDRPAVSITVCSYGMVRQVPNPATLTFSGTEATELQRSLENAPTRAQKTPCTTVQADAERNLAFVAVDSGGRTMRLVTTTLTVPICNTRTTNGITVRFGWVPPLGIRQQLYALTPSGQATGPAERVPSGKNVGSPVR